MKPRIVIAGGSGFLGGLLAHHFAATGTDIVILTRNPKPRAERLERGAPVLERRNYLIREVRWDGATLGDWAKELDGARALINLAGVSVNCRYHARNRKRILDSRLQPTSVLGEAIARCANPPPVWLNSSTATIYKHNLGPAWDEAGDIGGSPQAKDIFSVHVATEWERVFNAAVTPRTRKVALRSALVLGHGNNSALPNLLRLGRFGLGGSLAGGQQFVSWLHQEDFCRAVEWIIEHEQFSGVVNIAAPNPVTNAEFMATIRKVCRAPFGLPAPRWLLEIGAFFIRTETELIIKSRHVAPAKLLATGFTFLQPHLLPRDRTTRHHTVRTIDDGFSPSARASLRLQQARGEPLFIADWDQVLMFHFAVDAKQLQCDVQPPPRRIEGGIPAARRTPVMGQLRI